MNPGTVEEAARLIDVHGEAAMLIAGGIDMIPNMKHRLYEPEHLPVRAHPPVLADAAVRPPVLP